MTWLVLALAHAHAAAGQEPRFPSHDVRLDIVVDEAGSASVREEYALSRIPDRVNLELLSQRCARVGPIRATLGNETLGFDEQQRGPWTLFRDSGLHRQQPNATTVLVHYAVELAEAETNLPLVLPSAALERIDGRRGARVEVTVTFPVGLADAAVLFPRLERIEASSMWRGQLLAMPSLLRVRVPSVRMSQCATETSEPTGGLEWRFWLFAGIMIIWVPLYLWVFGRGSTEAA